MNIPALCPTCHLRPARPLSGECRQCWRRRYEATRSTAVEAAGLYVIDGYRFTSDASLTVAATDRDGLLGVVLTCSSCLEQLGPARSPEEASVEIVGHLRLTHDAEVHSALCAIDGCRELRHGGSCCRQHARDRIAAEIRERR